MLVDHGPPRKKLDGTGLHKRADMITWSRMHASFCFLSKLFTGHESLSSPVPSVPQVHTSSNQIRIHSFTSCRTYSNGFLIAWALQVATPSQTYPEDPRNFLTTTWKTGQIDAENGFHEISPFQMPAAKTSENIGFNHGVFLRQNFHSEAWFNNLWIR